MKNYAIETVFEGTFEEAVQKSIQALKAEGFGVLTDIDVKSAMKEKIGKEMDSYRILGACHPPSAYDVIALEPEIGLLLPCNVIVRQLEKGVQVAAIKPSVAMAMVENSELGAIAKEIEERLEKVIKSI